jgi:hypothetical protein
MNNRCDFLGRPQTVESSAVLPESEGPTRRSAVPLDLDFLRENVITSESKYFFQDKVDRSVPISKPASSAKESSNKLWDERPLMNGTTSGVIDIVSSLGDPTPS